MASPVASGEPITVQPSGAVLSGRTEEGLVEGRLELGNGAWTFRCLGEGADLAPEGWCAGYFSQAWIETWEG